MQPSKHNTGYSTKKRNFKEVFQVGEDLESFLKINDSMPIKQRKLPTEYATSVMIKLAVSTSNHVSLGKLSKVYSSAKENYSS